MSLYELVRKNGGGVIVVATKDLSPGAEVFQELSPLLHIPKSTLDQYAALGDLAPFYAAYDYYLDEMSMCDQEQMLTLHGPVHGGQSDQFRKSFRGTSNCLNQEPHAGTDEQDMELFVRIASIIRLNAFEINGSRTIFQLATRMSHSCQPNCRVEFIGTECICRTILPVRAGEELTIEYNPFCRLQSTCHRRRLYAVTKDFTCHCPRCCAVGDDTRQFPCFDPNCSGRHYCCAPVDSQPLPFADQRYVGVEYVTPHLLPCTVCQRPPPFEYQHRMLEQEQALEGLCRSVEDAYFDLDEHDIPGKKQVLAEAEAMPYPHMHSAAVPLNDLLLAMHWNLLELCGDSTGLAEAGVRALAPFEHAAHFPSDDTCQHLLLAGRACATDPSRLVQAVQYLRRALRMYLLLHGRTAEWQSTFHTSLAETLAKLQNGDQDGSNGRAVDSCAFCEERPAAAAITLQRCGQCVAACYCSAGCQRAHWKQHQTECEARVGQLMR